MQRFSQPGNIPKVVLDTNAFISAVLFEGTVSRLVDLWQSVRFLPLISRLILEEYFQTLSYPKFQLTEREIKFLVEDQFLPFVETILPKSLPQPPTLRDPDDQKFLECAVAGRADYLVTGDRDLLVLQKFKGVLIVPPDAFLKTI